MFAHRRCQCSATALSYGGKAEWYRNRWVRDLQTVAALREPPIPGYGGPSGIGANTNVIGYAGRTLALVEAGIDCYELTDELDTVGVCDFDGTITGGYPAHPQRDPDTGELHAVSYALGRGDKVRYSVIGVDGKVRESRFDDRPREFPRVDERLVGKRHRYGSVPGSAGSRCC